MRAICPENHKHQQTGVCYSIHRCGCDPCREAATARERQRRKLKAYGRYDNGLTDAGPVREHIETLRAYGIGWKRIAKLAGIGATTVETLIYGHKTRKTMNARVKRETAEAIMRVQPTVENLSTTAKLPACGTQRRLQALVWSGWSMRKLSLMLDMEVGYVNLMMRDQYVVSAATHRKVKELFDRLWPSPPPVVKRGDAQSIARAKNLARAKGWVSAWAWDDLDDPEEAPKHDLEPDTGDEVFDHAAVEQAIAGVPVRRRWTDSELEHVVRVLNVEQRMHDSAITELLGIDGRRVRRARERVGVEPVPALEVYALKAVA